MNDIIWMSIPDMPEYEASLDGQIRSIQRKVTHGGKKSHVQTVSGKVLKQSKSSNGYLTIRRPGTRNSVNVHTLIARTFLGPRPEGMLCDHIDGNVNNNASANLRYVSCSANSLNKKTPKGHQMTKRGTHHARVKHLGKTINLGHHISERSASNSVKAVRKLIMDKELALSESNNLRERLAAETAARGSAQKHEREEMARAAGLENSRDRLAAQVEALTKELEAHKLDADLRAGTIKQLMDANVAMRDRLVAEEKMCADALEQHEITEGHITEIAEAFDPEWEWSNLKTESGLVTLVHEHMRAHAVVKAERDHLKSELREAHRDQEAVWNYLKPNESNDMPWCDEIIIAIENRVLASVAESEAKRDQLKADLDAANERAERATTRLRQMEAIDQEYHKLLAKANDRDAARAEADAAKAEVTRLKAVYLDIADSVAPETSGANDVIDRIRAMRSEVARLKERKIDVRKIATPDIYGNMEACAFHRGITACADVARAAGVQVVES